MDQILPFVRPDLHPDLNSYPRMSNGDIRHSQVDNLHGMDKLQIIKMNRKHRCLLFFHFLVPLQRPYYAVATAHQYFDKL